MIGIDLGKNSFHIWAADEYGKKLYSKKLTREKLKEFMANVSETTVAMEACSGAHYWAREFQKMGKVVKLINPAFVKPFVKSNKNDFKDAEAICEAASRSNMRFVPNKSEQQQDLLAIHRAREGVICQRTQLINQIRGLLTERGLVAAKGVKSIRCLVAELLSPEDQRISSLFKEILQEMYDRLLSLEVSKNLYDEKIEELSKTITACQRLTKIPGIGPICATALYATVNNGHDFKNGREMSAWLGLVPKQQSTGGKTKLLGISKRGDRYLRKQLIHGARAVIQYRENQPEHRKKWINRLVERSTNVAVVALANKNARIAWSILKNGTEYDRNYKNKMEA